jgi:hypothetical protein
MLLELRLTSNSGLKYCAVRPADLWGKNLPAGEDWGVDRGGFSPSGENYGGTYFLHTRKDNYENMFK